MKKIIQFFAACLFSLSAGSIQALENNQNQDEEPTPVFILRAEQDAEDDPSVTEAMLNLYALHPNWSDFFRRKLTYSLADPETEEDLGILETARDWGDQFIKKLAAHLTVRFVNDNVNNQQVPAGNYQRYAFKLTRAAAGNVQASEYTASLGQDYDLWSEQLDDVVDNVIPSLGGYYLDTFNAYALEGISETSEAVKILALAANFTQENQPDINMEIGLVKVPTQE